MNIHEDAVRKAIEALEKAEKQFNFYAVHHAEKGAADKAATNSEFASMCSNGLAFLKLEYLAEVDRPTKGIAPDEVLADQMVASHRVITGRAGAQWLSFVWRTDGVADIKHVAYADKDAAIKGHAELVGGIA